MLQILAVVALMYVVGFVVVAKVAHVTLKRMGLELWSVLLWLGLAEAPADELAARRAAPVPTAVGDPRPLAG